MRKLFNNEAIATDVVVKEPALQEVNTDATTHTRLGWLIVLAGVGGFLLWATLAPLDKGVPVNGTVAVATSRKAVQHQTGGTIEEILVKDGDVVKAGQPLVRMNDVQVNAAAEMTRGQYFIARGTEARLLAERDGKNAMIEKIPYFGSKIGTALSFLMTLADGVCQVTAADVSRTNARSNLPGKITVEKVNANEVRVTFPQGATIKPNDISEADLYFALSRNLLMSPSSPRTADCIGDMGGIWCAID